MSERGDYANAATMSMAGLRGLLDQMIAERDALTKQRDALALELRERICDYECSEITCTRAPTCGNAHEVLADQPERSEG